MAVNVVQQAPAGKTRLRREIGWAIAGSWVAETRKTLAPVKPSVAS